MHSIFALDRYTNKYIQVEQVPPALCETLKIWDKIIYGLPDPKSWVLKNSIGTVTETATATKKTYKRGEDGEERKPLTGKFERVLQGEEKTDFEEQQQISLKIFPTFKKEFQAEYPNSVPITARFQIFSDQLYFFFYSEERYVFTEFVKRFKEKLGMNLFLFQVGARDMMRMSPGADHMVCNGDVKLCCKSHMMLPNVEIEAVVMQNLEGRDIERLKGKCWKLKCCLLYELEVYIQESKKYPQKWSQIDLSKMPEYCKDLNCEDKESCKGIVASFNIMKQEVNIKTKEGIIRIPISKLKTK